jgi:glycosyltransferase involved in cell wall biosynthesis
MRIAIISPASLPATQFGGILFVAVNIAKIAAKEKHQATIYTTDLDFANNATTFNKNLPREEDVDNFKIKRSHVWFSKKLFFVNPGMFLQMLNDDYDVIHSIGIRSFQSLIGAIISKIKKIPLVISDEGGLTTHPDLKKDFANTVLYKLQTPILKFIINQASVMIAANEYEKKIFSEFCDESKIVIVRNGIDLDILNIEKIDIKKKYNIDSFILFLGRFNKVKGIDVLINAINLIKNHSEFKKTQLLIMGVDFGYEKEMLRLIDEYKLQDKIKVVKNPSRKEVISAYNESEFLVLPSRWELSPLTPLEGFAFKKPVISSNVHGIPYTVIHNVNGILVEPENHNELANAITGLLADKDKCLAYGNAGYHLVDSICNSTIMSKEILKVYEKTINR